MEVKPVIEKVPKKQDPKLLDTVLQVTGGRSSRLSSILFESHRKKPIKHDAHSVRFHDTKIDFF